MHKRLLVGLLLAAAWPAASSGQTISWEIKKHSTNMTRFEAEVSGYVKRGCVPVGLTYDKREIYVMYLQGIEVEVSAWRMAWYDTVDGIREGINGKIAEGFIPSAITYTGDSFFVLFIKTPGQVLAWQIVPSSADLEDVGRKLKPYAGDSTGRFCSR